MGASLLTTLYKYKYNFAHLTLLTKPNLAPCLPPCLPPSLHACQHPFLPPSFPTSLPLSPNIDHIQPKPGAVIAGTDITGAVITGRT